MSEIIEEKEKAIRNNFHNNAAALIIAAAKQSGLLRDVANALHHNSVISGGVDCLACGVLQELTEEFGEHCIAPGWDFYGEGFCIPEYSDEELRPYLQVPFALPKIAGMTD